MSATPYAAAPATARSTMATAAALVLASVMLLSPATAPAQQGTPPAEAPEAHPGLERLTEHTVRFDSLAPPAAATLEDAAWLVGTWEGTGLGGRVREVWDAPVAGRMLGTFTSLDSDGGVRFHEIMALVEVDGSLELWVKHFDADFTAWEEGAEKVRFRLAHAERHRLWFGGLTLERIDHDRLTAHLALRQQGGAVREALFSYGRIAP